MRRTDTQEDHMRRSIRDAMAIDPMITTSGLRTMVEKKYNITMSQTYLLRLIRKVKGDIQVRYGPKEAKRVIAQLRETVRVLREEAFRIAYPPENQLDKPGHDTRLRALDLIAKLEKQQAILEVSFRVYSNADGTTGVLKEEDLILGEADEQIQEIAQTMRRWHFSPPDTRKIEVREVLEPKTADITNEQPKEQPDPIPTTVVLPAGQRVVVPKLSGGFQISGQ